METEVFADDALKEETRADDQAPSSGQVSSSLANLQLKPGYRDRKTGIIFVNATQQTQEKKRNKHDLAQCFTRETQLCETRNQHWNTTRETWTQVDRPGLILDATREYTLDIGPYKDSKAWEEKRNRAAIIIQAYTRRRLARCKAKRLQKYAQEMLELIADSEKKQKAEEDLHLKAEIHKHKQPRNKQDFDVLYQEVAAWHLEELQSIKRKRLSGTERKLALQELLLKEVKFFQAIERMKMAASRDIREEQIRTRMCKMSAPKKWEFSNGGVVHVQTLDTQRALDLMKLDTALHKCSRTVDERMCVLGYIKWTVQEFDCQLTKELVQLIERSADLMYRSRPTASLQGLRKRILDLFLKFTEVPIFNPEAAAYQRVPNDFDHPCCQTLRQQSTPVCLHG